MRRMGEGQQGTVDGRCVPLPRSDPRERTSEIRRGEAIGPQGAALIRELRRIQRAFDQEQDAARRARYAAARPYTELEVVRGREQRRAPTSGKRKGMVRRAVENCIRRFGLGIAPLTHRIGEQVKPVRPPTASPPPRGRQKADQGRPPHERPLDPPSPNVRASLELLRKLAEDAARQLASPELRSDASAERHAHRMPAALSTAIGRALTTAVAGAKAGYGYLLGADLKLANDASDAALATRIGCSFERERRSGLRVLILGLGVAGGWASLVPLSGAVVVTGSLVVESNTKKVQHPTGGIVAQIPVHDGMHVKAGDLVLRLDETQVRANLRMITNQFDEVVVRIARLVAERDGLDEPRMPPVLAGQSGDQGIGARFASEKLLFKARATARQSQKELLQSRIAQLKEQIGGLEAQMKSNASQLELIGPELEGVQSLYEKRLAPITRLNALQRDSARLAGERGQLQSTIAETKSKIGEAQLQMIRVDQDFRADVIKDLREAEAKEAELAERRVAAQDQLNRIEIRAPTSGVVHQLAVHTVGGVIRAGDAVMEIVPDADELQVEARLPPKDIDQVKVGQTTLVRFSAFNQRTTPQLSGVVSYVSADLSHEQKSETSYYTVRVTLPEEEHRRLAGLQLVSGMPAEIFVQTGSRTMMSYLLKPITDQLRRAFNDR